MKKNKCTVWEKLFEENWFDNKKEAESWVMMKKVLINEQPVWNLNEKVPCDGIVRIKEYYKKKYVNKGGFKLEKALNSFEIDANGLVALDCGASTGGFTDCWLQHGARYVYAVDVGYGQLAGKLTTSDRVRNMEKTNLADECLTMLDPKPEIISLDLSYLSLKDAFPICKKILKDTGTLICLIKPIYEVESKEIRRTGDINHKEILKKILMDICQFYIEQGVNILGITNSPVTGNGGTLEYLISIYWNRSNLTNINSTYEREVDYAIEESFKLEKYKKE